MRRIATVLAIALGSLGCQVRNVTAATASPSVANALVTLTVQVLTRGTEQPIAGVTVWENNVRVGETDGTGVSRIVGPSGSDFHISVTAAGYVGFGASGTVTSDERWRFYLEPQPPP